MNNQTDIKYQLVQHLKGGQAFSPIKKVLEEMPFEKIGIVPDGIPYSFYQLFVHIRIAQLDILEYCRDDGYEAPNWPDDYWPDKTAPDSKKSLEKVINAYFSEREQFCEFIYRSDTDIMKPFTANKEHNVLREAELIIEHTAYHTGQLYVIYRLVNK